MRLVCYVEPIPDVNLPIGIVQSGSDILRDELSYDAGLEDCCAVEEAVRIKEGSAGGHVTAFAVGGPEVIPVLRRCLGIGADQAFQIYDPDLGELGARSTAAVLAAALRSVEYELILTGNRGRDACPTDVPAYLAALLCLPQVSNVVRVEIAAARDRAVAWRKLERGWLEAVESPLPALMTADRGLNEPRYASLACQLRAWRQPIEVLDLRSLGLQLDEVGPLSSLTLIARVTAPQPRTKRTFIPDVSLSPEDRLKLIIGGSVQQKKNPVVSGAPDKLARDFLDFLKTRKILS